MKFKEGEEHFIWSFNESTSENNLQIATLHACDKCGLPATVNSVWVLKGYDFNFDAAKKQADSIFKEYGLLTELGADEDGNAFCEKCYISKRQ